MTKIPALTLEDRLMRLKEILQDEINPAQLEKLGMV